MTAKHIVTPKKLIEVALPLEAINRAAAREKSIRHGHPSTLHLWWARRPLAAARAVLFSQLVNDPSWKYTEEDLKKSQTRSAITRKRNELFQLISQLVQWENTNNEDVLERARKEIRASWRETCEANKDCVDAARLFNPDNVPEFHDPFAGGGAIPLEAQRLGLEAHASDLNPIAVLINKAMIEIPPRFSGRAPIGPIPDGEKQTTVAGSEPWSRTSGLAEDVRRYGAWMHREALNRIGHAYPKATISKTVAGKRVDLKKYLNRELDVIAWIWTRTVLSPNPAANGARTPLTSTFMLSTKAGKKTWIECQAVNGVARYLVRTGELSSADEAILAKGTRSGKAQDFICVHTGSPVTREFIREEGKAGRLGVEVMAVVASGDSERVYLSADASPVVALTEAQASAVKESRRTFLSGATPTRAMTTGGVCSAYGLDSWGSLFLDRQILTLGTLAELCVLVAEKVLEDAIRGGWKESGEDGGAAYGQAIATILAFSMSKIANLGSTLTTWMNDRGAFRETFARQALPMTWDFAEANPFSEAGGSIETVLEKIRMAIADLPGTPRGTSRQEAAQTVDISRSIVSTDPPYYDNIAYADLSDFFYPWLRKALRPIYGELFATVATPKAEELVATPYRHGSQIAADAFFLAGMTNVMKGFAQGGHPGYPVTVYYAFKQSETGSDTGTVSTGWETFLEACLRAGFAVVGTWPMRTEGSGRLVALGTNALASSIVLVLRPRSIAARSVARKDFLRELERHLPLAIADMTADPFASIAPVDLAQAAIGPGMLLFSRHETVLEADGSSMTVHDALVHINKTIDDYFAHAEGELDPDTRFCIGWFQQYGFESGAYGEADVLARAKGTAVEGVEEAGVLTAIKGKVRLFRVKEYPEDWDPTTDNRIPVWEACHHMCRALGESEHEAGALLARMPERQDSIRQLAYRLYTICERQKWTEEARSYNELIASWPAIVEESHKVGHKGTQMGLL